MAEKKRRDQAEDSAFRSGPPRERTPLRNNLESIALAFLLVLCVRQMVAEAFRIRHGSMAPTLIGDHREVRCPNCGWVFYVGKHNAGRRGEVECPNCRYRWAGVSRYDRQGRPLRFRRPEWLWNTAVRADGTVIKGTKAANRVQRGAARLFVNKFIYRLRKPRRWEVAVFLYPGYDARCLDCDWRGTVEAPEDARCPDCGSRRLEITGKNFIKRIIGLPGEEVQLKEGDVYINGSIAPKPPGVQESYWFHVFDSRFMPDKEVVRIWDMPDGGEAQCRPGGDLRLKALGSAEPVMVGFAPPIKDLYAYDGPATATGLPAPYAAGRHTVGDCRIRTKVRVERCDPEGGAVLLEIRDAGHRFLYAVPAGRPGPALLLDGELRMESPDRRVLQCGEQRRLSLENYDGRLVCRLDGEEVLRHTWGPGEGGPRGIRFGARGARVTWEQVVIERDIYYLNRASAGLHPPAYQLGADEYFVLGDNSPASSDSRSWSEPGIPEDNLIGRAFFVFWPVHYMKWLPVGAPERSPG